MANQEKKAKKKTISEEETENEQENEESLSYEEYKALMEAYFEEHADFFLGGKKDAQVAFLTGVLSAHLIAVQERVFKSEAPIWRSFGNMDLDERKIKWLVKTVVTKLQQFSQKAYPPKKLIRFLAEYATEAGQFDIDRVEVSWFFCIGLASRSAVSQRALKEKYDN